MDQQKLLAPGPELAERVAKAIGDEPERHETRHHCPQCDRSLVMVKPNPYSAFSREQFDAAKAGDWYCNACPTNDRGGANLCYWWERELPKVPVYRPYPTDWNETMRAREIAEDNCGMEIYIGPCYVESRFDPDANYFPQQSFKDAFCTNDEARLIICDHIARAAEARGK